MPVIPTFISKSDWTSQTSKFFSTGRSDGLKSIDIWLEEYGKERKPEKLEWLAKALEDWMTGKTKDGVLKTGRGHGPIATLKTAVDNARRLCEPQAWDARYPGIFIAEDLYRGTCWVPDDFVRDTKEALVKM